MKSKLLMLLVWLIGIYLLLKYGIALISAPLPASIIHLCMAIIGFSVVIYYITNDNDLEEIKTQIVSFVTDKKYRIHLWY